MHCVNKGNNDSCSFISESYVLEGLRDNIE